MENALAYLHGNQKEFLEGLKSLLRIPSISASPEHAAETKNCAWWLAGYLRALGFPYARVVETPGHPLVYTSWEVDPRKPTVLSYGHYDVQLSDPPHEWLSPPFDPTVRNNRLYARGANDDKGQLFTHIAALECFINKYGAPPVNVKLVIEGEEEIAGSNVKDFVVSEKEMLRADVVCVSDTEIESLTVPCLTYGLRGIVYYEITVRTASRDLHSGDYGGAAPNPFKFLARLIADAETARGLILIPGFLDKVRPIHPIEKNLLAARHFSEEDFRASIDAPFLVGNKRFSVPERIGLRPTFEVHGMPGGFIGHGSKTVIPASASAKVSMRLVPNQQPEEICELFENWVRDLMPSGLSVETKKLGSGDWWIADASSPFYEAARRALCAGFGVQKTGAVFGGGSIPVVPVLARSLNCPVVLLGFGMDDDNAHAPNESLELDRFFGGIRTMIHFYSEVAEL